MSFDAETLYNLLPAVYRLRDREQGEPLKALVQVLAREATVLETDLDQLYDDQFIETCAEWVVPYLGDLLGDRPLYSDLPEFPSARAAMANVMGYRRRKGTPAMLEQLARDVTGWPARVVEFFERLSTTQYMNHIRRHNLATPDLRRWQSLEYLGTPFETTAHTAEMRRIPPRRGRYNIPNIGLFLWRLTAYRIGQMGNHLESAGAIAANANTLSWARPVTDPPDGRYWFHPVGLDASLFNPPLAEIAFTLAAPINVPHPANRRVLYEELEAWRQAIVNGQPFQPEYFQETLAPTPTGARQPIFAIYTPASEAAIPPAEMLICDLSDWRRPPTSRPYQPTPFDPDDTAVSLPIQVAIDPQLGRLTFPDGVVPDRVSLRYAYGFSADVGGGPYDRSASVFPLLERRVTWQRGVNGAAAPTDADVVTTLSAAITEWNSQPEGSFGVITILNSQTYAETFPTIEIPAGSQLLIVAADWPAVEPPEGPPAQRTVGQVGPEFLRPHLIGDLVVEGTAPDGSDNLGEIYFNGLLIEGALTIAAGTLAAGNLQRVQLDHCTLVPLAVSLPRPDSVSVQANNAALTVRLAHTIAGPLAIAATISSLQIETSLIDGGDEAAIVAPDTPADIGTSTLLGTTTVRSLEASNSIFTALVTVERRQTGCVRFSSLPLASQAPRRYRCQPNLALTALAKALNVNEITDPSQRSRVERQLSPHFTARRYGHPAYGQLSQRCALEIRQGADDEAEMGVFHNLYQAQRETNLRVRLDEYVRFGLAAGVFYMT